MRIVVLFNPVSGSGRAGHAAQELCARLCEAGHEARSLPTRRAETDQWLEAEIAHENLTVVAGGDGAVRMAAGPVSKQGVPLYHYPCGTENLFAREFGMARSPSQLIDAVNRFNVRKVDLAVVNSHPCVLMASVGIDAEVVHDLTKRRGPAISHLSYVRPVMKQLLLWKPPALSVVVDGQPLVALQRGQVVVANCRQYGWRLNPAAEADMSDGLLDVVFFPARSKAQLIAWAWRCVRRRQLAHPAIIRARGKHVLVTSVDPVAYQIDGDPPPDSGAANDKTDSNGVGLRLDIHVKPACLPVLMPALE